jgi:O-methyltransferase involved in polyketide biosynthesis
VSQYVPKDALAETLNKLKGIVARGSILLISYVDQNIIDDPEKVGPIKSCTNLCKVSEAVGEPWISFWTPLSGFEEWMNHLGFEVLEDSTTKDYNEKYMAPLGRRMDLNSIVSAERYVVAKLL